MLGLSSLRGTAKPGIARHGLPKSKRYYAAVPGVPLALIHSPFTGPSVWLPFAEELEERGIESRIALSPPPQTASQFAEAIALSIGPGPVVLVGHSGAGPLLPLIAGALGRKANGYVLLDAGIPKTGPTPSCQRAIQNLRRGSAPLP